MYGVNYTMSKLDKKQPPAYRFNVFLAVRAGIGGRMEKPIDNSEKRLGELLRKKYNLTENELNKALEQQKDHQQVDVAFRLGEVLVESGISKATTISNALHKQRDIQMSSNTIGQILLELSYVTKDELNRAMEIHMDILAPFGDILVDQGICTREQVEKAHQLQLMRRITAIRNPLSSYFNPVNVMELLVEELVDDMIEENGGCDCYQCRANVFAVSLNGLAGRYISDMEILLDQITLYREEYGPLIRERVIKAVNQVRENAKLSCSLRKNELPAGNVLGSVTVQVSNRHIHLSEDHVERLFGSGYNLTKWKDLVQPGQFAAKETVALKGAKGRIERVRVLGPQRAETQVEISGTDQFKLGLRAPVRESGDLKDSPGVEVIGPEGSVALEKGVIRAWRHIHMPSEDGGKFKVQNRDIVNVILKGDRTTILQEVLVRISDSSSLEMHIDTDEANAAGVPQETEANMMAVV